MNVVIVGAGAMGCLYGAILQDKGQNVYLMNRNKDFVDAINQDGLVMNHVIDGEERVYKMKAVQTADEINEPVDLLIILVKTFGTDDAMQKNAKLIGENTVVLTLQNGAGNIEKIEKYVPRERILAGVTSTAGYITGPGKIEHTGNGGTHIGELDGQKTDRILELQELFTDPRAGECIVEDNVMTLIWEKLIANCGINSIGSLTLLRNGQELESEEKTWLYDQIVKEALAVAKAEGIKLPFDDRTGITKVCKATAANQTSMLIDVQRERKTEIEAINGEVVRKGRVHNIPTPVNETLMNLVLLREKKYLNNNE